MTSLMAAAETAKVLGINVALSAALIAAFAALVSAYFSHRASNLTRKATQTQRARDYRIRQLSELYGPLYMRRMLSRQLWRQLTEVADAQPGVTDWRLIDHIEEIKNEKDDHRRFIAEEILKINDDLSALIINNAGLLEQVPPPKSFEQFLEHAHTLRVHWNRGQNADELSYVLFPNDLDKEIGETLKRLRAELQDS